MNTAVTGQGTASPRWYAKAESCDFDEIALALRGMRADLRQLGAGPFRGEVEVVSLGAFQVMRIAVNRVIQARGPVNPRSYLVSLVTPKNERANWRGRQLDPGDLNVNTPASEIDHLTGASYDSLGLIVDRERLRAAGQSLLRMDIEPLWRRMETARPSAEGFRALQEAMGAILAVARRPHEVGGSGHAQAALGEVLALRLLEATMDEQSLAHEKPAPNRRRLARRAEEYMLAHLREPLLLSRLCDELGVSERTLRYAFRECLGVSPLAYFKSLKLNAIHRQIRATNPRAVRVQQIAREWGLVHFGNFAADYRRLFGEPPSRTAALSGASLMSGEKRERQTAEQV